MRHLSLPFFLLPDPFPTCFYFPSSFPYVLSASVIAFLSFHSSTLAHLLLRSLHLAPSPALPLPPCALRLRCAHSVRCWQGRLSSSLLSSIAAMVTSTIWISFAGGCMHACAYKDGLEREFPRTIVDRVTVARAENACPRALRHQHILPFVF